MRCLEQLQPLRVSVFFLFLLFSFSFASKIEIYLKDIVYLEKEEVLIKDIADVKSTSKKLQNYIESLSVDNISSKKVITKQQLIKVLKENFVDTSKVKIAGDQTIVVVKKYFIDENFIKEKLKQHIKKKYPDILIDSVQVKKIKLAVVGKPKILIKEKGKTHSYLYFTISIPAVKKEISASVRYSPVITAVVAKYPLLRGHVISVKDVAIKKVKIKRKKDYLDNIKDVVGKKLKRNIKKGQPISYSDLEKQFLVRKNSNVKVIYKKGSFKIELLGRALENGEIGHIIKVKNISSGKVMQCRVIGINKVEFLSGGF